MKKILLLALVAVGFINCTAENQEEVAVEQQGAIVDASSAKDPSFTAFTNKYNYIQEIDALLPDKKHTVYYGCTTYTEGDNWRNWKFKATTGDYFELHIQPGKSKLEWKYHDGGNWGHPLSDDAYAYAGDGQYLLIENFALLGWEGDSYWEGKYFNLWLGSVPADGCNWSLN